MCFLMKELPHFKDGGLHLAHSEAPRTYTSCTFLPYFVPTPVSKALMKQNKTKLWLLARLCCETKKRGLIWGGSPSRQEHQWGSGTRGRQPQAARAPMSSMRQSRGQPWRQFDLRVICRREVDAPATSSCAPSVSGGASSGTRLEEEGSVRTGTHSPPFGGLPCRCAIPSLPCTEPNWNPGRLRLTTAIRWNVRNTFLSAIA